MSDATIEMTGSPFVTPLSAALQAGVAARTIRNWVQQGKVSTQGVPPRRLVSLRDVQALAANVPAKSVTAALESATAAATMSQPDRAEVDTSWISAMGSITVVDDVPAGADLPVLDEKAVTSVYGFPLDSPEAALPRLVADYDLYAGPEDVAAALPALAEDALPDARPSMPTLDLLGALQMQYERSLGQVLAANERERAARDAERQQILDAASKTSLLLREQASIRQRQIHDVRQANHALLQAAQLREVVIQLREQEIAALRAAMQQSQQQIAELQVEVKRLRKQFAGNAEPRPALKQLICEPESAPALPPTRKPFAR